MKDLLKILDTVSRKRLVGTLVLGRGIDSFEIFFEDDFLYLPGRTFLHRVDVNGLQETGLIGKNIPESTVDNLGVSLKGTNKILPEILHERGAISEEQFRELSTRNLREEIFERLTESPCNFEFQDGRVPDSLIGQEGVVTRFPTPLKPFVELLKNRLEQLVFIRQLLPSDEEVFVITEKGMEKKKEVDLGFGFRRILDLLDGFRTLGQVIDDGFLFRFYVGRQLVELLLEGWIKKSIVPEIHSVDPTRLSAEEAEAHLPFFKNAIRYSTNELKAREGYATLNERVGNKDEAITQYNLVGDTLYKMGRKALAVGAYHKALSLRPGDPLITQKIVRTYTEHAEEETAERKYAEAADLYAKALQMAPDNADLFTSLLTLYLDQNKVTAVANLCDQAIAVSRDSGNPEFATAVIRQVLSRLEHEAVFQKKLINVYLDFGMNTEAANEMEVLARQYIDRQQMENAADVVEKLLRIDPGRKELRKCCKRASRRRRQRSLPGRQRFLVKAGLLLTLAMSVYQMWAYVVFREISQNSHLRHGHAKDDPERIHDVGKTGQEAKMRRLEKSAADYQRRFPISAFRFQAQRLEKDFGEAADRLGRLRNHRKCRLLELGLEFFRRGNDHKAKEALKPLLRLAKNDIYRIKAEEELEQRRVLEQRTKRTRRLVETALTRGDVETAYDLTTKLFTEFPAHITPRGITFPLGVIVVPPDLRNRLDDIPNVLRLRPNRGETISYEVPGYDSLSVTVGPEDGPYVPLFFNQKPLWKKQAAPFDGLPIILEGKQVFYIGNDGDLDVISITTGTSDWRHSTPAAIAPNSPALVSGQYAHLAHNNATILKFDLGPTGNKQLIKLDGFVQTDLVPLTSRGKVLFGTSSRDLVTLDFAGTAIETIKVPEEPKVISPFGNDDIVVLGNSGSIYRIDFESKRILWKSRLKADVLSGPVVMGTPEKGAVVVGTKHHGLVALDFKSGNLLWRRSPSGPTRRAVALLSDSMRILISEATDRILEVDPLTNETLRTWKASRLVRPFDSVIELGSELGIFGIDGAFLMVDPKTLLPTWRYVGESHIRSADLHDAHLVLVDENGVISGFHYRE